MNSHLRERLIGAAVPTFALTILAIAFVVQAGASGSKEEAELSQRERAILDLVETRSPETTVDEVDMERLRVRRIDVVDEENTIRMTIAGVLPGPIIDGIQYKRSYPVSGIMVRDDKGYERGGFGYNEGLEAPIMALDHGTGEGAGFQIRDGRAMMVLAGGREEYRSEALDGAILPGGRGKPVAGVQSSVDSEGNATLEMTDSSDRPRIRLRVTDAGHGAIEFLDADGEVVRTLAPEKAASE